MYKYQATVSWGGFWTPSPLYNQKMASIEIYITCFRKHIKEICLYIQYMYKYMYSYYFV